MNMKKSIAGVMAGAMAVSAMAATVSADQDAISLVYDLKTYVENVTDTAAKVTVVANYEGARISDKSLEKKYITFGADNVFVKGGVLYKYGSFQDVLAVFGKRNSANKLVDANGVEIDMSQSDWADKVVAVPTGTLTEFEFNARPYKDLVTGVEGKYQTFKATGNMNSADGAYYTNELGVATDIGSHKEYYNMPITTNGSANAFNLAAYDLFTLGYSVEENAAAAGIEVSTEAGDYAIRDGVAKLTYALPNKININKANGWGWNAGLSASGASNVAVEYYNADLYADAEVTAELFSLGFNNSGWGRNAMIKVATALEDEPTVSVGGFTGGTSGEAKIPFKSTLNPQTYVWTAKNAAGADVKITTPDNDVIAALQNRKAGGNYYTKPIAVLNDAIANHDNVTFTFKSYAGYVPTAKSKLMNQWVNIGQGYDYETSGKGFDWHNPTFGQHLYTNIDDSYSLFDTDDYDMYGSYSSAWGMNLFSGAVVVNNGLTMQLSDTDVFTWGNNYLTFEWFDITDEGKITDAKTFLTSMLLYTPVDWYWDTLEVVVSDEEEEEIDAGEGLDGEGDVIADEEPVEDIVEETEPEVEETEAETEAAPVETAPNPSTGNAPVALAVIPVALAAAAVVAKKRG